MDIKLLLIDFLSGKKDKTTIHSKSPKPNKHFGLWCYSILLFLLASNVKASDFTAIASGNWNTSATWTHTGAVDSDNIPDADDTVTIGAFNITVTTAASCLSIVYTGATNTNTLTVTGVTLTVSGSFTVNSSPTNTLLYTLTGTGTLNCGSLNVGSTVTPTISRVTQFYSSIANVNVSGNVALLSNVSGSFTNNIQYQLQSGTLDINGQITTSSPSGAAVVLGTTTGAESGTIVLSNNNPYAPSGAGNSNINLSGTGSTVIYDSAGSQNILPLTHRNITVNKPSGTTATLTNALVVTGNFNLISGTVDTAALTMTGSASGTFTMANTTSMLVGGSSFPVSFSTYTLGATSTVNFYGTVPQTVVPLTYGNVITSGSGAKTMSGNVVVAGDLTVNSGSSLVTSNNALTLRGNFTNSGIFTAGSSAITIDGAAATQSIAGFTTTGAVTVNKTAGTATLSGAMNAGSFSDSSTSATFNFGSGFTHTITGAFAMSSTSTTNANSGLIRIGGNMTKSGTAAFVPGTGTVEFYNTTNQSLPATATSFNNVVLSGSGSKAFLAAMTIGGNLSIASGVKADLRSFVHPAGTLTLGGTGTASGRWGSTTATNSVNFKNNTYFLAGSGLTGVVNVGTVTCTSLTLTGVNSCKGGASQALSAGSVVASAPVTTRITGFFDATANATADRPPGEAVGIGYNNTTTCQFVAGQPTGYVMTGFQVTASGNYTFAMDSNAAINGIGYIYTGNLSPGTCGGGTFVIGDDDLLILVNDEPVMNNVPLLAGVNYTLITTAFSPITDGTEFAWTITPPAGQGIKIMPNWYTTPTGGSPISTGSSFSPVGLTGSGLPNTNTAGTYTFYAGYQNSGCRSSVTYVINELPTITLAAAATPVCFSASAQTTPLAYTATTLSPTTYSITWNASPTNSFAAVTDAALPASPITINIPAGTTANTYTGTLTVKNGTCTSVTSNFTVTVNTLPIITGTLSVCAGLTTQLTGSATPNASNPWVSGTPSVATVNSTGLVTGVSAGTSIITYTNSNGCIRTATVTVNALPTISGTLGVCIGATTQLTGSATPNASNPWVSGTPSVATVNSTGLVTGVSAGTSIITYTNSNGCIRTATVTVNALPIITGTLSVCAGLTTQLTGSATPNASNPWVSGTPSVATVNSTGLVTGVSAGTSIITYTNSNGCIITATVTVNALPTISGTLGVCIGATTQLTGSATPNASNPWVSGTPSVATVNSTGLVTGVSAGTSIITYTNSNGCIRTATVTVNALPIITGTLSVCAGLTTQLAGSATPNASNPWVSGTPSVATVNSTGLVTGVSAGTSIITYTNSNGCIITATVTVNALPTISGTLGVCIGATTQLTGSATPNASNPWVSGTPSVATVNSTGLVTGVSAGTSIITYTNSNGCIRTATVTVNALPIITGTLSVCISATTQLTGSATPNASNPWVSGTPSVATVNSTGLVTGVSAGTSIITYTNSNGCIITATVTVNALPIITGTLSVCSGLTTQLTGSATPNASNPWVSGTPSVATVNSTGLVTGVSAGTSIITYTNSNGCIITATVTVVASSVGGTVSPAQNVCSGSTPIQSLVLSGHTGTVVRWQRASDAAFTSPVDIVANTATLPTSTIGNLTADTYFRAVVQSGSCAIANSAPVLISIYPLAAAPIATGETNVTCTAIRVNWNAAANATGYYIDVATDSGFTSIVPAYNNLNVNNVLFYDLTGLTGTQYYYRVRAYNTCSQLSANSTGVLVQTTALPAPIAMTGTRNCEGFIAEWIAVSGATSYNLSVATDINFTGPSHVAGLNGTDVGNLTSYAVTGLVAGTTYYFKVWATNGTCGISALSSNVVAIVAGSPTTITWAGSWSGGIAPTLTDNIVFDTPYSSTGNLEGCSCEVKPGVTVEINDGHTLTIVNTINVDGSLVFRNNATLLQTTDIQNTDNIRYERLTSVRKFDFTFWSSPVQDQKLIDLSPNTLSDKYQSYTGTAWTTENPQNVMKIGKGYNVRGPQSHSSTIKSDFLGVFEGIPNNGDLTSDQTILSGRFYLIGNPYPSAIDADELLADNSTILDGTVYFWTNNTGLTQNGNVYSYATNDYASYNGVGGVAGSGGETPSGYISAGQAVFAKTIAAGSVVFNNGMRVDGGSNKNGQFFKPKRAKKSNTERSRLWLNMTNDGGAFKQILIGYITGATNGYETKYDGVSTNAHAYVDFYSICEDKNLVIQGRAIPFEESDWVPLGYRSSIEGSSSFDITIANSDGVLANQGVFLEDKVSGTFHDLRASKYTFTTMNGSFKDRFILHFTNKSLGVDDFDTKDEGVVVTVNKKVIKIFSEKDPISSIRLFDLTGKLIYTKEKIDANEFSILNLHSSEQTLLVKVGLENGHTITKKIIYR